MKTIAERLAAHRPNPALATLQSVLPFAVCIGFAFLLQAVLAPALGPFQAKLLLDIGIAIVLAVSLNIVNGFAGQFSLGHGGFMMVGGYAAAYLTYYVSIDRWGSADVHGGFLGSGDLLFLVACIFGGVLAALAGFVVGLPSLRLRGDYLAIITLGFGEIMRVLLTTSKPVLYPEEVKGKTYWDVASHLGGSLGFSNIPTYVSPTPWIEQTGHAGIFFAWVVVGILLVVAYRLKTSAFFAGIGGALFAHEIGNQLGPKELGFQKSIDVVIMVVLGGMGSISGVVLAAIVLTIMPELFREFAQYRMVVYALALIIMMIVRPQGLFGIREVWELGPLRKLRRRRDSRDRAVRS